MKIQVTIQDEVLQFKEMTGFKDGTYEVEINNLNLRSNQQSRSMYLWLTQISKLLNSLNLDVSTVLKHDTSWSMEKVKIMIFDPIMLLLYGKTTTTKLNKDEYQLIIDTMTKSFGQKGITLPEFPSIETRRSNG